MRGLSESTKELIRHAYQILADDHPMTLRQLHYQIFSRGQMDYQNDVASYRRLSRATTMARRSHRAWELEGGDQPALAFPGTWIVDELRKPEMVNLWANAAEYVETVRDSYRRDNWQDQPAHVELWGEKATVLGSMRPIMRKFGITLRVCRGFGSTGMESSVGELFEDIAKPIIVLYIGDHDASGHAIEEDIHRRVETASGKTFCMIRLAIDAADIRKFHLPPQKLKNTDSRAAAFRERFGKNAATVELEALPVAELRRRVEYAVERCIDFERWDRQLQVQEVELASIADFADKMKNLPKIGGEV
jgi:hypothetical protein